MQSHRAKVIVYDCTWDVVRSGTVIFAKVRVFHTLQSLDPQYDLKTICALRKFYRNFNQWSIKCTLQNWNMYEIKVIVFLILWVRYKAYYIAIIFTLNYFFKWIILEHWHRRYSMYVYCLVDVFWVSNYNIIVLFGRKD